MSNDDASERLMENLRQLAKENATPATLAECTALLDLLPERLLGDNPGLDARVRRIRMVLEAVVARARGTIVNGPDSVHERDVLAAAALMGLVTYTLKEATGSVERPVRRPSVRLRDRQLLAGSWIDPPLTAEKNVRPKTSRFLEAFRYALLELLDDAQAVHQLADKMRPSQGARPDEGLQDRTGARSEDAATAATVEPAAALDPAIGDILQAQIAAARHLPYWPYDPSMPPLAELYIEPYLLSVDVFDPSPHPPRGTLWSQASLMSHQLRTISAALQAKEHILLIGDPGSGKSTCALQTVAGLSRELLDPRQDAAAAGPIPIYVPARMMTGRGHGLHGLIAKAMNQHLSGYLKTTIRASIFRKPRIEGRQWICFIDGLDEIVNVSERRRLIDQLRHQYSAQDAIKFVVTSRDLGEVADVILDGTQPVVGYRIALFDHVQAAEFSRRLFRARQIESPARETVRFLQRFSEGGARDVAKNPLLLTIAIIAYLADPVGPPNTLPGLYEAFVDYLLLWRQPQVRTRERLRRSFAVVGSDGERFADWLFDHRRDLCTHLAWRVLEGDRRSLIAIGLERIAQTYGPPPRLPDLKSDLENVLIDTGLISWQGSELRFIHRTVAEYLAAPIAGLPGPAENWPMWWEEEKRSGRGLYMHFRILAWARRHGPRSLTEKVLEAGWPDIEDYTDLVNLIEDGLPLDEVMIERLKRYVAQIHGRPLSPNKSRAGFGEADFATYEGKPRPWIAWISQEDFVSLVFRISKRYEAFAGFLISLVDNESTSSNGRRASLVALWRLSHYPFVTDRVRELARGDLLQQMVVAEFYRDIGQDSHAVSVAWQVACSRGRPQVIRRAALLLADLGKRDQAIHCLVELLSLSELSWPNTAKIADDLIQLGASDTVYHIVRRRLQDEPCVRRGSVALECFRLTQLYREVEPNAGVWLEERHRLLSDSHVSARTREVVWMLDRTRNLISYDGTNSQFGREAVEVLLRSDLAKRREVLFAEVDQ